MTIRRTAPGIFELQSTWQRVWKPHCYMTYGQVAFQINVLLSLLPFLQDKKIKADSFTNLSSFEKSLEKSLWEREGKERRKNEKKTPNSNQQRSWWIYYFFK